MIKFDGKLLILGCGSVAQCVLAILFDLINIDPSHIDVIDTSNQLHRIKKAIDRGVHYHSKKITRENYHLVLSQFLSKGDFLLDLAVEIDTLDLLKWCHDHEVLFVNTSIEVWDGVEKLDKKDLREQTLYLRHLKLQEMMDGWKNKGLTAIVEHGANPGLVSHFAKQALLDIAKSLNRKSDLPFNELADSLGVKVIHVSEIDTQVSKIPKAPGEFVNTWSCDGFIEEAMAPAELGWGIHEKKLPHLGLEHEVGKKHQILLKSRGLQSKVHSWVPSGTITGMVVRHGEAYSLCESLSFYNGDRLIYRPTVHYAYLPCQDAQDSLSELVESNFKPQKKKRIMTDEIVDGKDELGCLLMGDFGAWWIGTILDIHEARKLAPNQNATTVQVAIGVISALIYAIEDPNLGVCMPDDLDHERILKIAKPYLGKFISIPSNYTLRSLQFTDLIL